MNISKYLLNVSRITLVCNDFIKYSLYILKRYNNNNTKRNCALETYLISKIHIYMKKKFYVRKPVVQLSSNATQNFQSCLKKKKKTGFHLSSKIKIVFSIRNFVSFGQFVIIFLKKKKTYFN